MTQSPNFTIGTDPELILVNSIGEIVKADTVLNVTDKFGVDGHKYIAELRPDPATFPRDLVENLRTLLGTKRDALKDFTWLAGAHLKTKPLGGHIHFGVPFETRFIDALNYQLGIILALIEPKDQAILRRTKIFYGDKPYGLLGDYRTKDWGFEFRTPSSFISTPGTTLGVLTLAKAIIYEEMIRGKSAWSSLSSSKIRQLSFNKDDFHNCKKEIFRDKISDLWKLIKNMQYFKEENEGHSLWSCVAFIKNHVIAKEEYRTNIDIKQSWKLNSEIDVNPKIPPIKPLLVKNLLVTPEVLIPSEEHIWGILMS